MGKDRLQKDRFVHDRLPQENLWPEIIPLENMDQSGLLNCVSLLLDRHLEKGNVDRLAICENQRQWTYEELNIRVGKIANVLLQHYGIVAGNRVLIYAPNSAEIVAIWLAIQKIGAVAVTTLSLLRARELGNLIDISNPSLAICAEPDFRELQKAVQQSEISCQTLQFKPDGGDLYKKMAMVDASCQTAATRSDDVSIIAFTSGTTGQPKATVHFHRDIIAICQTMGQHIVAATPEDVFISTSPLAFTFGLGGLLVFPLFTGACSVLNARYTPEQFIAAIDYYRASICFTVPTFYQRLINLDEAKTLSNLRLAISSGEALPTMVRDQLQNQLGVNLAEVIGSTEMLHAFAGCGCKDSKPGYIGPAISGYELAVLDENGARLPPGAIGRLAVKGPTGCRYLDDKRQQIYVQKGWNITGDACHMDKDGHIAFHTRHDDMIVSAGYNISGLEIENVLLDHLLVGECAVIGVPDDIRGQIVEAHIVLVSGQIPGERESVQMTEQLQSYVKGAIAPYKYPRSIVFSNQLPKTATGKIQRHILRNPSNGAIL